MTSWWEPARQTWYVALGASLLASAFLWLMGGYTACGMEVYDLPPGSLRDSFCTTLVEPVVPWASLAALPFALSLLGGLVALRRGSGWLLRIATWLPLALAVSGIVAWFALD
jgi:hypothetical protein